MKVKKVRTICRICHSRCRIILNIKNGRIAGVEPDGETLCRKGRAIGEIVHAPDRILHPLKKEKGSWRRISWAEALDFIYIKLTDISNKYGPHALAVHTGLPIIQNDIRGFVKRFSNLYGTPNLFSTASQCNLVRVIGNSLTYGSLPIPDYEHTSCILVWGCNPSESNPYTMRAIRKATKRGAKLIVIDPRVTTLTRLADIHLKVRPEANRVLALGILRYLIREGLYDKVFVDRWTLGFHKLEESLRTYDFNNIQRLTGVSIDLIEQAARLYGSTKPACIMQGNGLEHHIDATQIVRAISIIQTISGNIDIPGGALITPSCNLVDVSLKEKKPRASAIGADKYSLLYDFRTEGQANLLADAILDDKPYPIRGMIIDGANPVVTYPNTGKIRKAFEKLEFLVVMDIFLTDSAKYADIFLPAATFLERDEIFPQRARYPFNTLLLIPSVLPEQGESWPDLKFWFELARKMGYGEYFPWEDIKGAMDFCMRPMGITMEQLESHPEGIPYSTTQYKKYKESGFTTLSGKAEIYSERLEKMGHQPLPVYEENNTEAVENAIILSTGARTKEYVHSQFKNIPSLRQRNPEPFAEISPETANKLNLIDGEIIAVQTEIGTIEIKVIFNKDILSETLFIPHGWGEINANILTNDRTLDPISGFPVLRSLPCEIKSQRK